MSRVYCSVGMNRVYGREMRKTLALQTSWLRFFASLDKKNLTTGLSHSLPYTLSIHIYLQQA